MVNLYRYTEKDFFLRGTRSEEGVDRRREKKGGVGLEGFSLVEIQGTERGT